MYWVYAYEGEEVYEMKKTLFFFGLVSVLSVALVASSPYAAGTKGRGGFMELNSFNLAGAAVKNSHGKVVGIVNEVMVDSGGHAFAVVNHWASDLSRWYYDLSRWDYDLYREGGVDTPVPFEELRISQTKGGQDTVFLKTDMEHLDFAPYLDPIKKETRQDEANIYEYYGVQPYWTQGGGSSK